MRPKRGHAWPLSMTTSCTRQQLFCLACLGAISCLALGRGRRCAPHNVSIGRLPAGGPGPEGQAAPSDDSRSASSALAPGTNGLVYDIGLNDGTDTAVYLQQNFSVVAVDANPFMVAKASGAFLGDVLKGRLRLLNVGLVDDARLEHGTGMGPQMDFYVHKTHDDWSSFRKEWGCRPTLNLTSMEDLCQVIPVPTTSCGTLVQSLGRAHFMKIDIEGYDMECIQSVALLGRAYLPDYVSVEGPDARKIEAFVLLGYSRFKIQSMQRVLGSFYRENNVTAMGVGGGSGPWGEQAVDIELGRAWRSQSSALAALGRLSGAGGDWYDLHVAF